MITPNENTSGQDAWDSDEVVEAVAIGIWEAGEAPCKWKQLTNSEQDEWREMARGGLRAAKSLLEPK